jgi:hypothetical protein
MWPPLNFTPSIQTPSNILFRCEGSPLVHRPWPQPPPSHVARSYNPIALARTSSSSAPSTAVANTVVEEVAAAAVSGSQQAGSISDALRHYGKYYWELLKARLRCSIFSPWAVLTHGFVVTFLRVTFQYKLNNTPSLHATTDIAKIGAASLG